MLNSETLQCNHNLKTISKVINYIHKTRKWKEKNPQATFLSYKRWIVVDIQSLSHVWLSETPWSVAHQASQSLIISPSLNNLMSIKLVMPSNYLILGHPLLFLPSIFPSIGIFSNESVVLIRWPKYWSFSFSLSPSNGYSVLLFFGVDWFDLLVVQETLKSLLQHHNSKPSILWCSAFLIVQLSCPYWKDHSFN